MDSGTRQLVRDRAGHRCEYCRLHQGHEPFYRFHIEHIIAKMHGGSDDPNNLALACHRCNERKGTNLSGRDSQSLKIVRLFDPRRQSWSRHFRFEGPRIVGATQAGRATVAALAMNSADRVELRAELLAEGVSPIA
ncbi:MAG TPA: HNH endonuclease [Phycisphaerae bacterium]|jgi:hypothetical protein